MRAWISAALLLSGCFDLEALYQGSSDLSISTNVDLARRDLSSSQPADLSSPDLYKPVHWVKTVAGVTNTNALRGIGGAGGKILAVGDNGTCLVSTDGMNWTAPTPPTGATLYGVWASAANDAWVVGGGSKDVYHYDGSIFTNATGLPKMVQYFAVAGVSATEVLAVGSSMTDGIQYNSVVDWSPLSHNYGAKQYGMWGMAKRVWTVGDSATGGYFDFQGSGWSPALTIAATAPTISFKAVWGTADKDVWAVGQQGNIAHYANAPFLSVFSSGTTNVTSNLNGVWGLSASNIWAVGDGGTILH